MGNLLSHEDRVLAVRSQKIDQEIRKDYASQNLTTKLLLLGTGECGKSTILKQMSFRILHSNGFTDFDRHLLKSTIVTTLVHSMYAMIEAMKILGIEFEDNDRENEANIIIKEFDNVGGAETLTSECATALRLLWNDEGIRECFQRRNEYQLDDSADYFLNQLSRIHQPEFVPSQDDILHCRVQTIGITETIFTVKHVAFRVFDVGGQRSERRKWIHCFDDVDCVIFISAISEFDQVLREDNSSIYSHLTCATDTKQVCLVIDSVLDMIIGRTLKDNGLI